MNTDQLTLDAGWAGEKRAFEVVATDMTNTARFGTKRVGSTTATQIKQNADGCFSDTRCMKQTGQKNVCCLFKDLLTVTDNHRSGQRSRIPGCVYFAMHGWQFTLNYRIQSRNYSQNKGGCSQEIFTEPLQARDWLHPLGWKQNRWNLTRNLRSTFVGRIVSKLSGTSF